MKVNELAVSVSFN